MRIKLKVHSNSSQEKILKIDEEEYEVWVKEKPLDGKANTAIEKNLKRYLKKSIKIVKGLRANNKIAEILD